MDGIKSRMKKKISQMFLPSDEEMEEEETDSDDEEEEYQQQSSKQQNTYDDYTSLRNRQTNRNNLLQVPPPPSSVAVGREDNRFRRESEPIKKSGDRKSSIFEFLRRKSLSPSTLRSSREDMDADETDSRQRMIIQRRSNSIAMTK